MKFLAISLSIILNYFLKSFGYWTYENNKFKFNLHVLILYKRLIMSNVLISLEALLERVSLRKLIKYLKRNFF